LLQQGRHMNKLFQFLSGPRSFSAMPGGGTSSSSPECPSHSLPAGMKVGFVFNDAPSLSHAFGLSTFLQCTGCSQRASHTRRCCQLDFLYTGPAICTSSCWGAGNEAFCNARGHMSFCAQCCQLLAIVFGQISQNIRPHILFYRGWYTKTSATKVEFINVLNNIFLLIRKVFI
jgi:hypothetical protein